MLKPESTDDQELMFGGDDDESSVADDTVHKSWQVLVVDDDEDVIAVTRMVFSRFDFEGADIAIHSATSGQQAIEILKQHDQIAVAYIDVVMEHDHAGLELVKYIRDELKNEEIQLILRTGQPGFAPEMEVVIHYGINDYRTKTELTNTKLITTLVSSLRNYKNIVMAKQVAQQKAVIEAVNSAKSLFFAQMSHEFRTPLNGIVGICDLLTSTPLNNEQRGYLRVIQSSSQHILSLVNDILDLSKAEAGKITLEKLDFNLYELIEDTFQLLSTQVRNDVNLSYQIADSVPQRWQGDPGRIKQILNNLLSNALKFTHQGSVTLSVTHRRLEKKRHTLLFAIADTGIGIRREKLEELFAIYTQAEESTTRVYGGTGLGLNICKQLARMMDGDITVTSEYGKGSEFVVNLVLEEAGDSPLMSNEPVVRASTDRSAEPRHQCRILVVDDDETNRMVARRMLEKLGYDVVHACDGEAALAELDEQSFDMILMDCQMPVLNGFETTLQIRQRGEGNRVPIVALTGGVSGDEMRRCFESGMNDFISKPMRLEDLKAVVTKWLGLKSLL